ncbi:UV-stimulated scaffold protein A isoform X3 [Rhinolophus sinicus]|uniref:UV-stimulated scaffold protein A isoform X3 n=1 Tax=Rhinolophus sinicus TaxID=89399 RepID=UPI003D78CBF6
MRSPPSRGLPSLLPRTRRPGTPPRSSRSWDSPPPPPAHLPGRALLPPSKAEPGSHAGRPSLGERPVPCLLRHCHMDQRLSELVEDLTTSGEPQLNPEKMKELKKICKASEEQLSHAYRLLMAQLSREHAEIRLSAFQIVDELFTRSHQFRVLVVSDLQEFLELTLGTDHRRPLPPPREVAQRLRQAATRAVQGWHERFGAAYKKLALGHHFLRHTQQVDFQDVNVRTPAERKREEEKQKRLDRIYRERAERAVRELEEMSEEIRGCLVEVESCFQLLVPFDLGPSLGPGSPTVASGASEEGAPYRAGVPDLEDEEQPCCSKALPASAWRPAAIDGEGLSQAAPGSPSEEDEDSDQEEFVRCHGLGSHKYTLDVALSSDSLRVREDEDNCAVVQSARDALKLIQNKYLPAVCAWVQLFTRAGLHGGHLEATINLKAELESALKRCGELGIEPEGARRQETAALGDPDEDDEEDDEGFVEVPEKEGYEACVPDHLWPKDARGLAPHPPRTWEVLKPHARCSDCFLCPGRQRAEDSCREQPAEPLAAAPGVCSRGPYLRATSQHLAVSSAQTASGLRATLFLCRGQGSASGRQPSTCHLAKNFWPLALCGALLCPHFEGFVSFEQKPGGSPWPVACDRCQ